MSEASDEKESIGERMSRMVDPRKLVDLPPDFRWSRKRVREDDSHGRWCLYYSPPKIELFAFPTVDDDWTEERILQAMERMRIHAEKHMNKIYLEILRGPHVGEA